MLIRFDPVMIIIIILFIIISFHVYTLKARIKEQKVEIKKLKEALSYFMNK